MARKFTPTPAKKAASGKKPASGAGAPAWTRKATKKAGAPKYTPRKAGGK